MVMKTVNAIMKVLE